MQARRVQVGGVGGDLERWHRFATRERHPRRHGRGHGRAAARGLRGGAVEVSQEPPQLRAEGARRRVVGHDAEQLEGLGLARSGAQRVGRREPERGPRVVRARSREMHQALLPMRGRALGIARAARLPQRLERGRLRSVFVAAREGDERAPRGVERGVGDRARDLGAPLAQLIPERAAYVVS
ncbi:MAG TPA: hypothetical protein DEF51_14380, partial [Myxococcales bacterium]|nr:hypothetical protein [Myxococcales bacterium]